MADSFYGGTPALGIASVQAAAVNTLAMSATTTRLAYSFLAPATTTVSTVQAYASAVTGTPSTGDLTVEIFSEVASTGKPNTVLASGTSSTVTAYPTGAAWVEFTGLACNVTGGVRYWIVLSCSDTSNYVTYRYIGANGPYILADPFGAYNALTPYAKWESTDSGSTWVTSNTRLAGFYVTFANGSSTGLPVENVGSSAGTSASYKIFDTTHYGVKFTIPASYPTINLKSVGFVGTKVTTPTGNLQCYVWTDASTSVQAGNVYDPAMITTSQGKLMFMWASAQALTAGSTYRITLKDSAADSSSAYYSSYIYVIPNLASARATMPFGAWGTTYGSSGSWTDSTLHVPMVMLHLDETTPFTLPAGGGGPLIGGQHLVY